MEFLRQTWLHVQEHLKGLTASQKIAIALCAGLIAVSLLYLVNWSVTPDMVALLDQSFKPDELARAQRELKVANVDYQVAGDRILVPAAQRDWLLARLQESEALPSDMTIGFAKLMEQQSIWMSNEDRLWQRDIALQNELAKVLRRFTGVRDARVLIARPNKRGFGDNHGRPQASVQLTMRENASVGQGFIQAVAGLVSGAVAGLKPEDVNIVDASGRAYRVQGKDSALAADLLAERRQKEEHYAEKIRSQLAFIPGVLVNVFADIETEVRRVEDRQVKTITTEEETTSNNERAAGNQAEPGVMPNVAASVPNGTGGTARDETTERTRYAPGDQKITMTENTRGEIKRLTASVNIPRSYMVQVFKQRNGQDKTPTDQELDPIIAEQIAAIKAQVKPLIKAEDDEQVTVGHYYDMPVQAETVLASTTSIADLVAEYGRPASLGGLAALSLVLMLVLVRKAQPPAPLRLEPAGVAAGGAGAAAAGYAAGRIGPVRVGPDGIVRPIEDLLTVEGGPVGKAQPTQPILQAREVDETTLKNQQIIEQVNNLVKDDPDSVASMLRKWIEEPH